MAARETSRGAALCVLRLRFDPCLTFTQWLRAVRVAVAQTSAHSELPFERLVAELNARGLPVPNIRAVIGLGFQVRPASFSGLKMSTLRSPLQVAPTGFTFLPSRHYEDVNSQVYFDVHSYDPREVSALVDRYRALAEAVCREPDRPLRELLDGTSGTSG